MFQYAAATQYLRKGEKVAIQTNYVLPSGQAVNEDIEKLWQRPYGLHIFNNLRAVVDQKRIKSLLFGKGFINNLRRDFFYAFTTCIKDYSVEKVEMPSVSAVKRNMVMQGNFQSERYFAGKREELLADFAFPRLDEQNEALFRKIANTPDAVSIHVRKGDYLSSLNRKVFDSVNNSYYQEAVRTLQGKLGTDRLKAFVFTDDPKWVKQHLGLPPCVQLHVVVGNTGSSAWKDMALMTACQHHIIANSTFSWWGAWLSRRSGINLAPKHWFLPDSHRYDLEYVIPQDWIIVDYPLYALQPSG